MCSYTTTKYSYSKLKNLSDAIPSIVKWPFNESPCLVDTPLLNVRENFFALFSNRAAVYSHEPL